VTRSDLTLLAVLVDHSMSMLRSQQESQDGLNAFIETQRNQPGELDLAMAQFDHEFEIVRPMGRLTTAYRYQLVPRGNTALLDALGRYITEIGGQLADVSEENRPAKVVMVIVTDGEENASREFCGPRGKARVKEMVERQRNDYQWEFVFLGANIDAIEVGMSLGMTRGSTMTFNQNDGQAVMDSFAVASANIGSYRSGLVPDTNNFTEEDRKKAMGDNKATSSPGKGASGE
jgi:uncharacterized protein YegL